MSRQIIEVSRSVVLNGDKTENMAFELGGDTKFVQVAKILGNGSCLFSAMAHQLFYESISADKEEFAKRAKALRAEVVDHITANYERFEITIRGRIFDNEEKKAIKSRKKSRKRKLTEEEVKEKCISFLKDELPQSECWGGEESLVAISGKYKVNVVIIREGDTLHFIDRFNSSYEKTICLGYRLACKPKQITGGFVKTYNHYDSICGINSNVMFDCANILNHHDEIDGDKLIMDDSDVVFVEST